MIGSTLAHYRIEAVLGQGGMGTVYRARDTRLDRTVAIKVLAGPTGDALHQLLREARAASALTHSAVVTIHSVEQQADSHFIVMEYVAGQPLSEAIPPGGLPLDAALGYAIQIAAAAAAAHQAGIVHRDIKPANIMITAAGDVKVLDFGVARRSTIDPDAATRAMTLGTVAPLGAIIGTIGYMAPEQITGGTAQPASDVFSIGAVMYQMLTGTPAFAGETTWAVMDATVHGTPVPLETARPDVPHEFARVVMRCLAKSPGDRYPSAAELLSALHELRAASATAPAAARGRTIAVAVVASILALAAAGTLLTKYVRERRAASVRAAADDVVRRFEGGDPAGAYRLMRATLQKAPGDSQLQQTWSRFTFRAAGVTSDPPGADVAFRSYGGDDDGWIPLGRTPLPAGTPLPMAQVRWRVTKPGYDDLEVAPTTPGVSFALVPSGRAPAGMVYVPDGTFVLESANKEVEVPAYWIDRFEVTNREFKQFIDRGGYRTRAYWTQPIVKDGRTLSFDEAMAEFRDATGRPGPSTWEVGTYPDGQDDFPVSGVSWYEAAAYAASLGKTLPTAYHWYRASGAFGPFSEVLRFSNFGSKAPVKVGSLKGLGPFGTYDMAGNVKEWCWNDASLGRRYILGGAFNEAPYQFRDQDGRAPISRGAGFGFRCIKGVAAVPHALEEPIVSFERDPESFKPVNDAVFGVYRRLYDYDAIPLDARIEEQDDTPAHWTRQRVSFRAAYGGDRVPADVYVPRTARAPYQAVVYFPGAEAVMMRSSRDRATQWIEFLIRSGRLVIFPVYQHTYERHLPAPLGPNVRRQLGIERAQDFRRAVDYLESRSDVDRTRIAGYGLSLGAQLMPLMLAVEPRLRTGVLLSGGFESYDIPPEWDPVNFAPRVKQPVLMVNGREDFDLPYASAQVPLFNLLGTAPSDKHHEVLEGGHLPPKPVLVYKVILDWLDKYLGPTGA